MSKQVEETCRNCDYIEDLSDKTDLGICELKLKLQKKYEDIDPLVDGTSWCPRWSKQQTNNNE
jgi:hypothetical protein